MKKRAQMIIISILTIILIAGLVLCISMSLTKETPIEDTEQPATSATDTPGQTTETNEVTTEETEMSPAQETTAVPETTGTVEATTAPKESDMTTHEETKPSAETVESTVPPDLPTLGPNMLPWG